MHVSPRVDPQRPGVPGVVEGVVEMRDLVIGAIWITLFGAVCAVWRVWGLTGLLLVDGLAFVAILWVAWHREAP
jgi:hypothetical protein